MALAVTLTGPTKVECGIPATFRVHVSHDDGGGKYKLCFSASGGCKVVGQPKCVTRVGGGDARFSANLTFSGSPSASPSSTVVKVSVTHAGCGETGTASKQVQCVC